MKETSRLFDLLRMAAAISLLCCPGFQWAAADTHYVSLDGGHVTPFTNGWPSAARDIQSAINAAVSGDTVLVSNGVYQTGGITNWPYLHGLLTNRVVIPGGVTVQSFNNDPTNTIIKGSGPDGPAAVRCVYLRSSTAKLVGFTVTGGASLLNANGDYEDKNSGGVNGPGIVSNCIIVGNTGQQQGGGVVYSTVYNSLIISNISVTWGGGLSQSKVYNSIIRENKGSAGGGTWAGSLSGCIVANNAGAGAAGQCNVYNSLLYGNSAGAVSPSKGSTVDCCTIVGNIQGLYVEGAVNLSVFNSIIYSNKYNWLKYDTCVVTFSNTCTTPTNSVAWAPGNFTNNPMFVDFGSGAYGTNYISGNYHLRRASPCINAGVIGTWMAGALDLDGNKRVDPGSLLVDMGCYEYVFPGGTLIQIR